MLHEIVKLSILVLLLLTPTIEAFNKRSLLHSNTISRSITKNKVNNFLTKLFAKGERATQGSTAVETRVEVQTQTQLKDEIEKNWRLILHDDDIHTIPEVVEIVASAVPLCPGPRAYECTLEVHLSGAATLCIANKKMIEEYMRSLQSAGLTVSMAPDEEFEDDGEYATYT